MTDTGNPAPTAHGRRWLVLILLCLATVLLAIDMTVLHLAVPALIADVAPSSTQLLWIADIYGFALGGLLITMGNLGDRFGRKKVLMSGLFAFGAASALTALAPNAEILIGARALLGIAGATIMPTAAAILRNVFSDGKERSTAIGVWSAMSASGFALGPVVGGLLLDHFWWGSVFLINVPVMLVVLVAGLVVIPESRNPEAGPIDVLSVVLSFVGIIALIYGIKTAAHDGVGELKALAGLALGVLGLGLFIRRQTRLASPLMDLRLFRSRVFAGAVATNVITVFGMIALSLVLAQYLQLVLGWSPLLAGVAGIPGGLSAGLTAPFAAKLAARWGRGKTVALGMVLLSVSLVLYTRLGAEPDYLALLPAMMFGGAGMGVAFALTNDIVLSAVPKERSGAAVSIVETATEMGGALGIAVLGSVMSSAYSSNLDIPAEVPAQAAPAIKEQLAAALQVAANLPGEAGARLAASAKDAFVDSMHITTITGAIIVATAAVLALVTLRGKFVPAPDDAHDEAEPVREEALTR